MEPYNYSALMTQLNVAPLQQGLAMRNDKRQIESLERARQAQVAQQAAEAARKAEFRTAIAAAKPDDIPALMRQFPDEIDTLQKLGEAQSGAQHTRNGHDAMEMIGLIQAGKPDAAKALLTRRKAGLTAGQETTEVTDAALEALERGDTETAVKLGAIVVMGSYGKDAAGILEQYGIGRKAEREDARDQLDREKFDETKRHNRAQEGVAQGGLAVRQAAGARADRKAASGGGGGGARKGKRGGYTNADLDALLQ